MAMGQPNLASLNLNALVALDALLTECNVTRAAKRVRITQPAMSQTLARLRELFDDPLLVRKGRGMVRTPRADAMVAPLSEALQAVERAVQLGMGFDPSTSKRIFRVAMTDLHVMSVLPGVLEVLGDKAPDVRIQAEPMALSGLSERIGAGEVDLALGFLLSAAAGLRTETLRIDDYVVMVRKGHPLARKKRLRVEDYAGYHLLANTPVTVVPRSLSGTGFTLAATPRIRASLPYILGVPAMVRATDLVATMPRSAVPAKGELDGIVTLEAPPELPKVEHCMWWHPRFDRDPAHQWLRQLVRAQFGKR